MMTYQHFGLKAPASMTSGELWQSAGQ
jgi:holliday junction DNA helicase RuvB